MNESASQPVGLGATLQAAPMKPWAELSEAEKIETLRNEMRQNRYLVRHIGELQAEVHRLKAHEHGADGKVLIPLHTANANGIASSGLSRSFDPLN